MIAEMLYHMQKYDFIGLLFFIKNTMSYFFKCLDDELQNLL